MDVFPMVQELYANVIQTKANWIKLVRKFMGEMTIRVALNNLVKLSGSQFPHIKSGFSK